MHLCHRALLAASLVTGLAALTACRGSSVTACGDEPNLSGAWTLSLTPTSLDLGAGATIPGPVTIEATLEEGQATDFLGIGHYLYGSLTASDPSYFGTLMVPRLVKNDGGKTGVVLGCELRINVPVTTAVTDDNVEQGPLRLALIGQITAPGTMLGLVGSRLLMESDAGGQARDFAWTAARR